MILRSADTLQLLRVLFLQMVFVVTLYRMGYACHSRPEEAEAGTGLHLSDTLSQQKSKGAEAVAGSGSPTLLPQHHKKTKGGQKDSVLVYWTFLQ